MSGRRRIRQMAGNGVGRVARATPVREEKKEVAKEVAKIVKPFIGPLRRGEQKTGRRALFGKRGRGRGGGLRNINPVRERRVGGQFGTGTQQRSAKSTRDVFVLKGRDRLTAINSSTTEGAILYQLVFNPSAILGSKLAIFSQLFEKYTVTDLKFHYVTASSKLTDGSIMSVFDYDYADNFVNQPNALVRLREAVGHRTYLSSPTYQNFTLVAKEPRDHQNVLWCKETPGRDPGLVNYGRFTVMQDSAGADANQRGKFDIEYTIKFTDSVFELDNTSSMGTTCLYGEVSQVATAPFGVTTVFAGNMPPTEVYKGNDSFGNESLFFSKSGMYDVRISLTGTSLVRGGNYCALINGGAGNSITSVLASYNVVAQGNLNFDATTRQIANLYVSVIVENAGVGLPHIHLYLTSGTLSANTTEAPNIVVNRLPDLTFTKMETFDMKVKRLTKLADDFALMQQKGNLPAMIEEMKEIADKDVVVDNEKQWAMKRAEWESTQRARSQERSATPASRASGGFVQVSPVGQNSKEMYALPKFG